MKRMTSSLLALLLALSMLIGMVPAALAASDAADTIEPNDSTEALAPETQTVSDESEENTLVQGTDKQTENSVAKVGAYFYDSFEAAVAAAAATVSNSSPLSVYLLADVTVTEDTLTAPIKIYGNLYTTRAPHTITGLRKLAGTTETVGKYTRNLQLINVVLNQKGTLEIAGTNVELSKCTIQAKDVTYDDVATGEYSAAFGYSNGGNSYLTKITGDNVKLNNSKIDGTAKQVNEDDPDYFPNMLLAPVSGTDVDMYRVNFNQGLGACYYSSPAGTWKIRFCTFNKIHLYNIHAAETNAKIEASYCDFAGWVCFSDAMGDVSFKGCTFAKSSGAATVVAHKDATFTNCKFTEDYAINEENSNGLLVEAGATVEMTGCTVITDIETKTTSTKVNLADIVDTQDETTNLVAIDATKNADGKYTAGTFVGTESAIQAKLAAGLAPKKNSDGTYSAVEASSVSYVAKIGNTTYDNLAKAFNAAKDNDEIIISAGTYKMSELSKLANKTVTVSAAAGAEVVFDNAGAIGMGSASVTFKGITFDYLPNQDFTGLQHSSNMVYENCVFNGAVFLYGTSETFNNCTFNQTDSEKYNVWTYGARNVAFNKCQFNCAGKSVLIYNEGTNNRTNLTVTETKFVASETVDKKAAIEIDTSLMTGEDSGATVIVDDKSSAESFSAATTDENGLWNVKKKNIAGNEILDVTVADEKVYSLPVASINDTNEYPTLEAAINAASDGDTVKLLKSCNGNGVAIDTRRFASEGLIVDFHNKTYTVGGVLVGSSGTGTNVFQLLQGGKVTFQNGTIEGVDENTKPAEGTNWVGSPAIVIQNYCDLTLSKMIVKGGTDTAYTVSNNNGNVLIEGSEIIAGQGTEQNGPWALDACVFDDYAGPTVTVKNSTINGRIEISHYGTDTQTVTLSLEGNTTVSGELVAGKNAEKVTVKKVDTVNMDAPTGYKWVENTDGTQSLAKKAEVAQIGETKYETLAEAIKALKENETLTLLADVENVNYAKADVIDIKLPAGATLDGNGNTISGNIKVNVNAAGGTIKNVIFKDIHDATELSADQKERYGFSENKVGTLTAIYASKLTGALTIDGCTFENADWESIQITPDADANITITNNIFRITKSEMVSEQLRYIHIQNNTLGAKITANITDNQMYAGEDNELNTMGIWYMSPESALSLSGNYMYDVNSASVASYDAETKTVSNKNELVFPARAEATVDEDTLTAVAFVVKDNFNVVSYQTLQAAVDAVEAGETIKLLDDCASDRINLEDKDLTVDLNGHTLTSTADYGVMFCAKNGHTITINGKTEGSTLNGTVMVTEKTFGHIVLNGGTYANDKYCPIYINGAVSTDDSTLTVTNAVINATIAGTATQPETGDGAYLAGYSTATFTNTTINAEVTGLEIRAGELTMTDCTVTGGTGEVTETAHGNGATVRNAAIAVSQHTTKKPINVTIVGGKYTANAAFYQSDVQNTGSKDVKTYIKSGEFNGTVEAKTSGALAISGGTFSAAVKPEYCAKGFIPTVENGKYTVKEGSYVAEYNGTKYASLQDAIDAASQQNGGQAVVTLLDNVTITQKIRFVNETAASVLLDLNGKTLTGSNTRAIQVYKGSLYLENGTVTSTGIGSTDSVIRIGSDEAEHANASPMLFMRKGAKVVAPDSYGVTIFGATTVSENLTVYNASIEATGPRPAISGQGSTAYHVEGKGTVVTISGTATVSATNNYAIYHPDNGTLNIYDSPVISGKGGIQMCSGTLKISGSPTITATGKSDLETGADGPIYDIAAISVANRDYPGGAPVVTIEGTPTITAVKGEVIHAYTWSNNIESEWAEAGNNINVSGGTYSKAFNEAYLAADCTLVSTESGQYTVKQKKVAEYNGMQYTSLSEALKAAKDSGKAATVKLLDNVTVTNTLDISGKVTITLDLNQWTLTLNGAQLFTSGSAAIINGTIKRTDVPTTSTTSDYAIQVMNGSTLLLGGTMVTKKVTLESQYGIYDVGGLLNVRYADITTDGWSIAVNDGAKTGRVIIGAIGTAKITSANGNCIGTAVNSKPNVTINKGTLTSSGTEWGAGVIYWASEGTLTISGGTFTASSAEGSEAAAVYQKNGTVKISGATTKLLGNNALVVEAGAGSTGTMVTELSGGSYSTRPDDSWVVEGKEIHEKDGLYVVEGEYVVELTVDGVTTGYSQWSTMIPSAQTAKNAKITLLKDIAHNDWLAVRGALTIDFNGHTLTVTIDDKRYTAAFVTDTPMLSTAPAGSITLMDSTGNGGLVTHGVYGVAVAEGGTLTIESGNYDCDTSAVQVENGTAYIKGGTFKKNAGREGYLLNCKDEAFTDGTAVMEVTGGTFYGFDPSANPEGPGTTYVKIGYESVANTADSSYTVEPVDEEACYIDATGKRVYGDLGKLMLLETGSQGRTITLLQNAEVDYLIVDKERTLDINGKTLTVTEVLISVNGSVADSSNGNGLIAGTDKCLRLTPDNGSQLPIYDSKNNGYRLFTCVLTCWLNNKTNTDAKIQLVPDFTNADAYELLKTGNAHNLKVTVTLSWENSQGVDGEQAFAFRQDLFDRVAAGKGQKVFTLMLTGLDKDALGSITQVKAICKIESGAGTSICGAQYALT